jgi:hypothetical protein
MERVTQLQLLEGGFWDLRRSPILKLGKAFIKGFDPTLYNTVSDIGKGIRDTKKDLSKTVNIEKYITSKLARSGYVVVSKYEKLKGAAGDDKTFYKVSIQKNPEWMGVDENGKPEKNPKLVVIVDEDGNIHKNMNNTTPYTGGRSSQPPTKPTTPKKP